MNNSLCVICFLHYLCIRWVASRQHRGKTEGSGTESNPRMNDFFEKHFQQWNVAETREYSSINTDNTMAKVYQFMADGFEDIEALAPLDILKRGGVEVVTVSIMGREWVESANGVTLKADRLFEDTEFDDADMLLLPGGMPGASHLKHHEGLRQLLLDHAAKGRRIGAICAAPMVPGSLGLLEGKRATCYPGFESQLKGAEYTGQPVTVDDIFVTGKGPGASLPYSYQLLSLLAGDDEAKNIQQQMMYPYTLERDV